MQASEDIGIYSLAPLTANHDGCSLRKQISEWFGVTTVSYIGRTAWCHNMSSEEKKDEVE